MLSMWLTGSRNPKIVGRRQLVKHILRWLICSFFYNKYKIILLCPLKNGFKFVINSFLFEILFIITRVSSFYYINVTFDLGKDLFYGCVGEVDIKVSGLKWKIICILLGGWSSSQRYVHEPSSLPHSFHIGKKLNVSLYNMVLFPYIGRGSIPLIKNIKNITFFKSLS